MRASILITDDDRGFRETLRGVFEPEGFHTLLAENGAEALDIVRHSDIHLLLLDMHMPRLTGLETLRIVKQMKSRLPCILLSAHPDEGLVRQAFEADAFSFLTKPVSRRTITSTVRLALANTYDWAVEASDDHEVEPTPRHEQDPAPPAIDPRLFRRDT
ncbi:MAG TPA: response regulator [Pirellulales bacterium]|nr:response regulator [Pirellulales bacterium]